MSNALAASRLHPDDYLRVGSTGLRSRRLRAILSALGIAIGIAAMVGVLGISASSKAQLLRQLDQLGTNLLTVTPGRSLAGGTATLPSEAADMIERMRFVNAVSAVATVDQATVRRHQHIPDEVTGGISVRAADSDLLDTLGGTVRLGTFLNDATAQYPVVVLGSVAAERLGIARADGSVSVFINGHWFTVVGILEPIPLHEDLDRTAFVGFEVAQQLLQGGGSPTEVHVRTDPEHVTDVRTLLAATANPENPQEVLVSRPSDALAARAAASSAYTALFLGLGGVALLVGGVGVANVMVISVLERRPEIGLRRALGATRNHIRTQFLAESLLLSALGGIVGTALGALVSLGYAASRGWQPVIPPAAIAGGIAAAVVIGATAGLYPAMRAARLAPTEALRTV